MAQGGTLFSYVTAFVTVVIALAVTDLLMSLHRLLRARKRVRWHWLPIAASLLIWLTLLTEFFELWRYTDTSRITFYGLVMAISEPLLVFMAAAAVLPDEVPGAGMDLELFYFEERAYIWTPLLLSTFPNIAINLMDRPERFTFATEDGARYLLVTVALFAINLPLIWSRHRWVHGICIGAMLLIANYGFSHWAISGAPATAAG